MIYVRTIDIFVVNIIFIIINYNNMNPLYMHFIMKLYIVHIFCMFHAFSTYNILLACKLLTTHAVFGKINCY